MSDTIFSRQTSKGPLVVEIDSGEVLASLNGYPVGVREISRLAAPADIRGVKYTHSINQTIALTEAEFNAIQAAKAAFAKSPRGRRLALTQELARCTPGAYPGTEAWHRENAALKALAAFDDEHPEVLSEIGAERRIQGDLYAY